MLFIKRATDLVLVCSRKFNMASKKLSWETEKVKYLSGDTETRRANYFCGKNKFVPLDDVKTWAMIAQSLPEAVKSKTNVQFNSFLNEKVSFWKGDITLLEIDAIVNAANSKLAGGGGVDGAIHKAAGSLLLEECKTIKGGCPTGQAKITGGYKLPAKYIIHTVGPINPAGASPTSELVEKLTNCYLNSLNLANDNGLKTIAFPCISTGIYNYPNEMAAEVALGTTRKFLEKNTDFERVIFCVFLEKDVEIYQKLFPRHFPANNL